MSVFRLDLRSKQSIAVPAERDDRFGQVAANQATAALGQWKRRMVRRKTGDPK